MNVELIPYKRELIREVEDYFVQSPSSIDFIEDLFYSPRHELNEKKRFRSEFILEDDDVDDENASHEAIQQMAKRIKLLENEIRLVSETQQNMQKVMETLIKKFVWRANKPMIKKIEKSTAIMEEVVGDRSKLRNLVNL